MLGALAAKSLLAVLVAGMSFEDFYKAYNQAELYFARGEYNKAHNIYKKIRKDAYRYGFGPEIRYRIAESLFNEGKFDQSVKEFKKLADDKDVAGSYLEQEVAYGQTLSYTVMGDIQTARSMLQSLQQYPYYKNSPRTNFLEGIIQYREGKFNEAALKLEKSQEAVPESKFYYARCLAITKRPLDAIAVYKSLLTDYAGTPREGLINYGIIEANFVYGDYKGTATMAETFINKYHGHPLSDYVQYFWGLSLYRLGYMDQALDKMNFLAKKKSFEFNGLAAYYAGNCEVYYKKYDEAIKYYQYARSNAGDNVVSMISFLRMAEAYFYKGDSSQAYLMADQLRSFPLSPEEGGLSEYMTGAISYALDKYSDAVLSFETAIENYPKSYFRRPSMAMLLLSLVRGRSFDQAVLKGNLYWPEITEDTTNDLWDGWFVFGLAEGLYYQETYGEAEKKYNWNVRESIHKDLILLSRVGLGWVYLHQGWFDEALAQFRSIEAAATDTSTIIAVHLGLGVAEFNKGNYMEAFREFSAIASSFPDREKELPDVLYYKGFSAKALKSYGDAIKFWEEDVVKFPNHPKSAESAFQAADIYVKAGEYQKSISLLKWLLEHFPNYYRAPRAQFMLAEAYVYTQDFESALKEFQKFRSVYAGHELEKNVTQRMEQIYYKLATDDPEMLEPFVEEFPESELAATVLYNQAAKAFEAQEDEEAAELFFKLSNEFPKSEKTQDALYYAGTIFFKLKKFNEGVVAFRKFLDFFPEGDQAEECNYFLGLSQFQLQDYNSAIATLTGLVEKYPSTQYKADAMKFSGFSYVQMGETSKAARVLKDAINVYRNEGKAQDADQLEEYIKTLPQ